MAVDFPLSDNTTEQRCKISENPNDTNVDTAFERIIGTTNLARWNQLKELVGCSSHKRFASLFLDIAQKYLENEGCFDNDGESSKFIQNLPSPPTSEEQNVPDLAKNALTDDHQSPPPPAKTLANKPKKKRKLHANIDAILGNVDSNHLNNEAATPKPSENDVNDGEEYAMDKPREKENKSKLSKRRGKTKKHVETEVEVRKTPELREEPTRPVEAMEAEVEGEKVKLTVKVKMCQSCGRRHVQEHCPLYEPLYIVADAVTFDEWSDLYWKRTKDGNGKSYANCSLPHVFHLADSYTKQLGVFAKTVIDEFTQFGPLVGRAVKEMDIAEDFDMQQLWEIHTERSPLFLSTENDKESNWLRFVRPAFTRHVRNVAVICKQEQLFLVSVRRIECGEEIVYWQDDLMNLNKKRMEKTACGGCNMTFSHPLYYRTHCSVFHDVRYSLTIRKYHCKVCGEAVLGKENIVKHAAEQHKGQGAYQCQFCQKFFLRLNYLEMHRTYGCSANPHRSRPLCDFCGRKFCQPQKLKVHIKRMHSDLSEVLKEFQCKNCLKLLGSRAALQRHMKEVHNKQVEGACACSRCGKLFQNKSNLKIHMLTHSGIKPFKCIENGCAAAFTTKQCLQFHYKKAHGFTDERMPTIQRSVDYTFEAYSGRADDHEPDECNANDDEEGEEEEEKQCNLSDDMGENDVKATINNGSEEEDEDDDEDENNDERIDDEQSSPPTIDTRTFVLEEKIETYPHTLDMSYPAGLNMKILTKGSKKWLGEQPLSPAPIKPDLHPYATAIDEKQHLAHIADDRTKMHLALDVYHHESNASLLVEAALDSVADIHCTDMHDAQATPPHHTTATDPLHTLCTQLPDYAHATGLAETRDDLHLITPTVINEQIVGDALRHTIDYAHFHHDDFSAAASPPAQHHMKTHFAARDYIDVGAGTPPPSTYTHKDLMSRSNSPRCYSFGGAGVEPPSSDDSNGMGVQNLSLPSKNEGEQQQEEEDDDGEEAVHAQSAHDDDDDDDAQLNLPIYGHKSAYELAAQMKFDQLEHARKPVYVLELNEKLYNDEEDDGGGGHEQRVSNLMENICCEMDVKQKGTFDVRTKYDEVAADLRNNKYDVDAHARQKMGDLSEMLRTRTAYELEGELRAKAYGDESGDGARATTLMDTDFRIERNFEPLLLNTVELQGLDMSARSTYHNYHPTGSFTSRYHPLYPEVERELRLTYGSPPPPPYTHSDVLRVVSLDLTSPGRHSVDLSLRTANMHPLGNARLLGEHNRLALEQTRLLLSPLPVEGGSGGRGSGGSGSRLLPPLPPLSDANGGARILSDHSTNRILSNEVLAPDEPPRLLDQGRLIGGALSPTYANYSISPPTPYHPTALPVRPHASATTTPPYHHYPNYY